VCSGSSACSQIAAALLRHVADDHYEVTCACIGSGAIHPNAIWTLEKYGVPAAGLQPKVLAAVAGEPFDYVITLGDRALERCPIFPRADMLHWSLADPSMVSSDVQARAFDDVFRVLLNRIRLLVTVNERRIEHA